MNFKNIDFEYLFCALSTNEIDKHVCKDPLVLSCNHNICTACRDKRGNEPIYCCFCKARNTCSLNKLRKCETFNELFKANKTELTQAIIKDLNEAYNACKNVFESMKMNKSRVKEQIKNHIEGQKLQLGNVGAAIENELNNISKKFDRKCSKSESNYDFHKDLKNLEILLELKQRANRKDYKPKSQKTVDDLYFYQDVIKRLEKEIEKAKKTENDLLNRKVDFTDSEFHFKKRNIGKVVFEETRENVINTLNIVELPDSNTPSSLSLPSQSDQSKKKSVESFRIGNAPARENLKNIVKSRYSSTSSMMPSTSRKLMNRSLPIQPDVIKLESDIFKRPNISAKISSKEPVIDALSENELGQEKISEIKTDDLVIDVPSQSLNIRGDRIMAVNDLNNQDIEEKASEFEDEVLETNSNFQYEVLSDDQLDEENVSEFGTDTYDIPYRSDSGLYQQQSQEYITGSSNNQQNQEIASQLLANNIRQQQSRSIPPSTQSSPILTYYKYQINQGNGNISSAKSQQTSSTPNKLYPYFQSVYLSVNIGNTPVFSHQLLPPKNNKTYN